MSDSKLQFGFSEFSDAASHPVKPRDLPFETAYNDPSDNSFFDILFKKIELNKNHVPTRRGWKTLNNLLSVYRNKRYETSRYLLLDTNGDIVDHVAFTNRIPDRSKIHPDSMSAYEYLSMLYQYVSEHNYKIIIAHNHPSGDVYPSKGDREVTALLSKMFGDFFAGNLILDHGSFGLLLPGKMWELVTLKSVKSDPLVKQNRNAFFDYDWNGGFSQDRVTLMRCALKIDSGSEWNSRDWVAVVFASAGKEIKALHYYHTSEFNKKQAADFIRKKTSDIAMRSGAIWAFAFTENDSMLKPIKNIAKETGVFMDFYVNGVIGYNMGLGGLASKYFSHDTEFESTIHFQHKKIPQSVDQHQQANTQIAAVMANDVSYNENYFYEGEQDMQDDTKFNAFYQNPFVKGTVAPDFYLQEAAGFKAYSGFNFMKMNDDQKSLVLAKKSPEGKEETVTIASPLYQAMIDNAGTCLKKPATTPEVLHSYDRMIAKDAHETRPNRAVDFWHNYKVLCRRQASNPAEAMEVAKSIVRQMPAGEQKKLKRTMKAWEKKTRKLTANPLLRPFVKPQETFNQRILRYYEENVRDLPIKNTGVHGQDALGVIRRGVASRDFPGQAIDPALRLKIGGTVKLALDCKTLFGERRKRLPIAAYTVVSSSEDLNNIVLLDKAGNSKYTLARDAFCEKMQKLEKKLEKRRHKQDKHESLRY
jgi:proteasome lid subunit RPN8/RPN11